MLLLKEKGREGKGRKGKGREGGVENADDVTMMKIAAKEDG